jgi:hypothetical protein
VSIRLMRQGPDDHLRASAQDCEFDLTLCS